MKASTLLVALAFILASAFAPATEAPKKPAPAKPAAKKPTPKPRAKPVPSRKDMAIKEAASFDKNKDGKLDSLESMALNQAFKANPDSFLYLLDDNENKYLDAAEIAKIPLPKPAKKP
jgi:hypothetical protein